MIKSSNIELGYCVNIIDQMISIHKQLDNILSILGEDMEK